MPATPAAADRPTRPAFRDGRVLRAADLRDEAADRMAADRRHQAGPHTPGVAAGLWLAAGPVVTPGMAVDGLGRWLLVPDEYPIKRHDPGRPWEVWLAYREAPTDTDPTDADLPPAPPPGRLADRFEVLFEPPGRYDPAAPAAHPDAAVFLGTVTGNEVSHLGRVHVGAVAARVEAASRTARLLLAPERPGDPRVFAVGTRPPGEPAYADRLAAEDTGTFRIAAPVDVAGRRKKDDTTDPFAAVLAGFRPVEFTPADVLDPTALAAQLRADAGLTDRLLTPRATNDPFPGWVRPLLASATGPRLAELLADVLNRVTDAPEPLDELVGAVRGTGAVFRPETVRRLLDRAAGLPRHDGPRLARMVLEDAFPGLVCRLPEADDGPRGVAFVGASADRPAVKGSVYLAEVADKAGTYRELRVAFEDPGKENRPERYKAAVGTVGPAEDDPAKTSFGWALRVDATKTVTVKGELRVYRASAGPADPPEGLILQRTPAAADPNDPTTLAQQLAQVAPWNLRAEVLDGDAIKRSADGKSVTIGPPGVLINTGSAPIEGAQLHAVVFTTGATRHKPVERTLIQPTTLKPGEPLALKDPVTGGPFVIPLGDHGKDAAGTPVGVSVVLLAVGAGPGGVQAGHEVRWDQ